MDKRSEITVRELYPHLTDAEQREAEENLQRYLELALRIYKRIRSEPETYAQLRVLTEPKHDPSMHAKRSTSA